VDVAVSLPINGRRDIHPLRPFFRHRTSRAARPDLVALDSA
jgi:hypothetical protein